MYRTDMQLFQEEVMPNMDMKPGSNGLETFVPRMKNIKIVACDVQFTATSMLSHFRGASEYDRNSK